MKISRKRIVQDLSKLVQIPSWQECDTICSHLLSQAGEEGLGKAHMDESGNVLIEFDGEGPALLLNAHVDTVPPGDYQGDPFSGKVVDGRIIGRGASDDKAGVASLLEIARLLKARAPRRKVIIGLTVWEESTARGENGARRLAKTCGASQCIVLESTMDSGGRKMAIDIGCRGIQNLLVTIAGKSCHSARPEQGENAVSRAARIIPSLEEKLHTDRLPKRDYRIGNRTETLGTLATITQIEAMQGLNVIPGSCRIYLNCRLLPDGGSEPAIAAALDAQVAALPKGWMTWEVLGHIPGHVCTDEQLIQACRESVLQMGLRNRLEILPARTDTTIFQNDGGIQSVVLGPGTMDTAHKNNEYASIDNLTVGTETVWHAVERLVY